MLFKSTLNMKQIAQRYLPPHNCCFLNRSPGGHHGSHTIGHTQWLWDRKTHTHTHRHTHTHTHTTHIHTHNKSLHKSTLTVAPNTQSDIHKTSVYEHTLRSRRPSSSH